MKSIALTALCCVAVSAASAPAATVLFSPLDSLQGWTVRSVGAASASVVDESEKIRCVEVNSSRGTILLSRELPLEMVRGCRVTVSCSVKSENVVIGPQASSTGKVHLAVQTPRGIRHFNDRFDGTADWQQKGFAADVPEDAVCVRLNLGLEACFGRATFDRLIVKNDRRGVHPLNLVGSANAEHGQLGIGAFPEGKVEFGDVSFNVVDAQKHGGVDCIRLRGVGHDDWPARVAPIPVGTCATAIYILHAALDGRPTCDSPTAIWQARCVGGDPPPLSVFEGQTIGPLGSKGDLENWSVAWEGEDASGKAVTFGVTKWTIYTDMPVESIFCEAYQGAPPVILAATAVEEPPVPEPEPGEFDDPGGAGFGGMGDW